jgi:hypothetical protein
MGNCVSGKIQISLDDKLRLEISKIKGEQIEVNLVNLVENLEKYKKEDREWVKSEVKKYLQS